MHLVSYILLPILFLAVLILLANMNKYKNKAVASTNASNHNANELALLKQENKILQEELNIVKEIYRNKLAHMHQLDKEAV